jgi:hypothetical protein
MTQFHVESIHRPDVGRWNGIVSLRSIKPDFWRLSGLESSLVWLDTIPLAHRANEPDQIDRVLKSVEAR